MRGKVEHDSVRRGKWDRRVKHRNMRFECQVSDDSLDALEGDLVGSCIVAGESGDGIHEVKTGVIAEVKEGTDEGAIGAVVLLLEGGEFLWSGWYRRSKELFEG